MPIRLFTFLLLALPNCAALCAGDDPWRLDSVLRLPEPISVSGQTRVRFENLANQFRAGGTGGDQVLVFRTSLLGRLDFNRFRIGSEMLDAREALADSGTPLSTGDVNPVDLLQAWVEIPFADVLQSGSTSLLRGGRMTMDFGSRRLVARNSYRNAINAFTGIDWQWTGADNRLLRLFYTLPVQRRAGDDLLHADTQSDKERGDFAFWGAWYAPAALPWGGRGEFYLYRLNEDDGAEFATRDRDLYSVGLRLYRAPAAGRFDYQLESVLQFGESRASTSATDTRDLDHLAHFQHVELGYSFDGRWQPRLLVQFDYASGDDDPADGDNGQFDTLFGARRFDFGPTGIYGPFARANLASPGIRATFKPAPRVKGITALRGFWLASDRDAWTTARVRDPTGQSGNHVGTQLELQLQYAAVPGNLDLEAGVAHILDGEFMDSPPGTGNGDVTAVYLQATISF